MPLEDPNAYRQLIGKLVFFYLTITRHYIDFAVHKLSTCTCNNNKKNKSNFDVAVELGNMLRMS